jgi:GcrA cell cycle regulator
MRVDEWPEDHIAYLRDNWGKMPASKIGQTLDRTKSAVIGKAYRLGLERIIATKSDYRPVLPGARAAQKREYAARRRAAIKAGMDWAPQPKGPPPRVTLTALESLREIAEQPFKHEVVPMPKRPSNPAPPPFRRQPLPPATRSVAEALPRLMANCECRWPLGDPKSSGFRFCDEKAIVGEDGLPKPYCAEHMKLAYVPKHRPAEAA